ncbi:MAG TPA: hypothetical protein VEM39_00565 [Myxococcaceae bacterium]|nr:hypothetical protein [Myxococcaceae bacterium]
MAQTRKQAAVDPFPPSMHVLPEGHEALSPGVQVLLQYPPGAQG